MNNAIYDKGIKIIEGQIEKIHFADDTSNRSKGRYVEYDVSVREALGGQSLFHNVRKMNLISGGFNDFDETILEANEVALVGKLDTTNRFENKNGTKVVIAFINGNYTNPIIIGALQHDRQPVTTRKEGVQRRGEFRGMQYLIDKDGAFTLKYNGSPNPDGSFESAVAKTSGTTINIDKQGILTISDNIGNVIKIDRVAKSVVLTSTENTEQTVGKDHNVKVTGNQTNTITGNQVDTVTGNQENTITGNQTNTVTGDQTTTIEGMQTNTIKGDVVTEIAEGGLTTTVAMGDVQETIEMGAKQTVIEQGNWTITATLGNVDINAPAGQINLNATQINAIAAAVLQLSGSSVALGGGGPGVARLGDAIIAGIFPGIIVSGSGVVTSA